MTSSLLWTPGSTTTMQAWENTQEVAGKMLLRQLPSTRPDLGSKNKSATLSWGLCMQCCYQLFPLLVILLDYQSSRESLVSCSTGAEDCLNASDHLPLFPLQPTPYPAYRNCNELFCPPQPWSGRCNDMCPDCWQIVETAEGVCLKKESRKQKWLLAQKVTTVDIII